ncbi:MAG: NADPH:quinone oxidoreductase [Pseudonocardiales bacterium]|nr:MAG: NADPH:quinone oxidoreductase [Pseudonocardiales bacterium]
MKAVTLPSYGGPDVLTWADVPDPTPGPGQVLIDVAASAVNRADIMQRMGRYAPPPGAPDWPGLECSGRIAELGEDVVGWEVGDEACALLSGGGYAEQVVVPAGQLLPIPQGVPLVDAAGLPEVACTVWSNVFMAADLKPGEVFLVHGGSSGIGTMAIQLAVRQGARVFCTAGTASKRDRCRELGAEVAIDYRNEDFVAVVREATGGHASDSGGADVILDNMGASYLSRNIDALATGGRLVVIGLQGGATGELPLGTLLSKRASITATSLRFRPAAEKAEIVAAVRANVWPAIEAGAVRPVNDRRIPMAEAAQAHRVVEASEHIGKVLLVV